MAGEVKRFDIYGANHGFSSWEAEASPDGRYVEYEDHAADRAALEARVTKLTEERNHWRQQRDLERSDWEDSAAESARLRADRAALVAQLEAANRLLKRSEKALSALGWHHGAPTIDIREHLSDQSTPTHAALVAQLAELTRERDEARAAHAHVKSCLHTAEARASRAELDLSALQDTDAELLAAYNAKHAEVTRLTEALAAAERRELADLSVARDRAQSAEQRAEAAEARVRELEAEVNGLREQCRRDRESAEARVRELEADHAEMKAERDDAWNRRDEEIADRKALETLIAASEARADSNVALDRLAALKDKIDLAKRLATETLRDSDDAADALGDVLEALRG